MACCIYMKIMCINIVCTYSTHICIFAAELISMLSQSDDHCKSERIRLMLLESKLLYHTYFGAIILPPKM